MRKATALFLLIFWPLSLMAQVKCKCVVSSPPANAKFFGMTQNSFGGSHNSSPPLTFGVGRLWDTACVWGLVNTANGTESWGSCDSEITYYQSVGATVSFVFGRTPKWAITGTCTGIFSASNTCAQAPSDLNTTNTFLTTFVTDLVHHFNSTFPGMRFFIEGVNEADLAGEWATTNGAGHESMVNLVTYQNAVRTVAKALDPTITVLGPSASTYNQFGAHLYGGTDSGSAPFTGNGFLAAGGGSVIDAVNVHPYFTCTPPPNGYCQTPETFVAATTVLQSLMASNGIATKPIIASETDWGSTNTNGVMTDDQKSAWLARIYVYGWNYGYAGVWWYAWDNNAGNLTAGFGTLCTGSGTCTPIPAATAYQTVRGWILGATHASGINPCIQSGTKWTCSLFLSGGASAQILFDTAATPTVTVPSTYTTAFLLDGTNTPIVSHQVTLGLKPIMVRP